MPEALPNQILGGSGKEDSSGFVSRTVVFKVKTEEECLTVGRNRTFMGLPEKKGSRTWKPTEAGEFHVNVTYEGRLDFEDEDEEEAAERPENFQWITARSEEPIESHPLINQMVDLFQGVPDPDDQNKIKFPRFLTKQATGADGLSGEDTQSGEGTPNPMYGRDSYLFKSGIWRWKFGVKEYPHKWEAQDGRVIKSVPGGRPTPENKDWLVLVQSVVPVGSGESLGWDVTIDFALSEEGGWPPPQYIFDLNA